MRIAFYEIDYLVNLVFEERTSNITAIQLFKSDHKIEFTSPNKSELETLAKFLKIKLNLFGFHESFKCIKQIGKGHFANVFFILIF